MTQSKRPWKHQRGRPSMNLKRRCIGLSEDDYDWLKAFGLGNLTAGIREAIKQLKKGKG